MSTNYFSEEEAYAGYWFRASSYKVAAGHVRSGEGAEIERYNPWDGFEISVGKGKQGGGILERPYTSLIELHDIFKAASKASGGFAHLDPETWPLIQHWYQKHGWLGLFLIEARQVDLYPRWQRTESGEPKTPDCFPTFTRQIRTPTGWHSQKTQSMSNIDALLLPAENRPEGSLVPKEFWSADWDPGVLVQTRDSEYKYEAIERFMGRFFPSVSAGERETYSYPTPLHDSFWKSYSEPVGELFRAANLFSTSVRALARFKPIDDMSEAEQYEIAIARRELMYLASQVNPALNLGMDGTCSREWVCTSLLASYAMMVLLDAAQGALNICGNCERVFVSSAGRARFCSPKCRRTQLQREWRGRKKQGA